MHAACGADLIQVSRYVGTCTCNCSGSKVGSSIRRCFLVCSACTVVVLPIAVDVVRNVRSNTHAAVEIVVVVPHPL